MIQLSTQPINRLITNLTPQPIQFGFQQPLLTPEKPLQPFGISDRRPLNFNANSQSTFIIPSLVAPRSVGLQNLIALSQPIKPIFSNPLNTDTLSKINQLQVLDKLTKLQKALNSSESLSLNQPLRIPPLILPQNDSFAKQDQINTGNLPQISNTNPVSLIQSLGMKTQSTTDSFETSDKESDDSSSIKIQHKAIYKAPVFSPIKEKKVLSEEEKEELK